MRRALTNQGDTAIRTPLVEAGDARLVRETPPALRAETRPPGAHGAAASSAAPAAAPTSRSASGSSSLSWHLHLLVGRASPTSHA